VIWPDNTIHWVRVHGKVLYDPDKKPQRMYGTVIDVTGEKQRSDELEKKVEERTRELKETITELARSNNDLEQFAYVASHDLNEPIRIVSTYTSLFAKKYADNLPEGATVYMDYIMEGTSRMRQLIKDLLQYARTGNAKLPFSKIDCNKVLNVVIHNLADVIKETGATVTSEKLPVVNGIETQLGQLFQNLVENGIKFRGKNPVIIKISVAPHIPIGVFVLRTTALVLTRSISTGYL
jgi:light-regulated signal transduction histidine kinase (bacteriophytochrome)